MKHLSRRDFVHAGCTVAVVSLIPPAINKAEAWFKHGYIAPAAPNNSRVSLNVPTGGTGLMNLSKSWEPSLTPAQVDANGFPSGVLGSSASSTFGLVSNYYGAYAHSWSGLGGMQWIGQDAIIYNGGTFCGLGTNTGIVTSNFGISGTSPNVTFKFGTLVTAISGGNGSLVTITTASLNFGSGVSTGTQTKFGVGCSSNLSSGPNADGSWTITNVSATQFTLNGSTGVISPTITNAGGVGTQTEAVFGRGSASLQYNATTFTNFTNLVVCTSANANDVSNGLIWDPLFVAQLQQLKGTPSGVGRAGDFWLRFMDVSQVQGSYECDFSQRLIPATQCWTMAPPVAAYQAGAITNTGASGSFTDVYSCASNPSNSPGSGPPIDCEVIQGTPSATNSGGYPGLTVSGRSGFGTWPIIDNIIEPIIFNLTSGASGSGLSMVFTFAAGGASWLNLGSNYTFTYTTVSGDTNVSALKGNLQAALALDATLAAAKIIFTNSGNLVANPPTPLSGALTITYTSGPAIVTMCSIVPSAIGSSGYRTFVFNALLGSFLYVGQTFARSYPFEAIVELCNRVGANCWYTWPIYTKASFITSATGFFASNSTGLTAGLKFGTEVGNENWNTSAQLWHRCQTLGIALGLFSGAYGADEGPYGWQGLRTILYANLSVAAWTAVRSANQHYIMNMSAEFDTAAGSNFDLYCLRGQYLVTSNSNYANYGGLGATSLSTSYNSSPNRPVDSSDALGCAPYWGSPWFAGQASIPGGFGVVGTVTQNAPMLQASFDFANGSPATAFGELTNQFNGTTTRSGGASGGISLNPNYTSVFTNEEAQAAQYDSGRPSGKNKLAIIHYEGGPQWAAGSNFNNGVNSADSLAASIPSGDITALVNQMTALSWTTAQLIPYTVSGTGNLTEVATNILQMGQGWKYDTDLNGSPVNTGSYKNLIKTYYYQSLVNISGANRETHAAQYGYAASQWGLFWNSYNQIAPAYQNDNAISEFNV